MLSAFATGQLSFQIYPHIEMCDITVVSILGMVSFGVLSFMPFIIELKEELVWKYSLSKI